jgi:hypothetical protein
MGTMILSYRCKHTEALLASGDCHRDWQSFARIARRKLLLIDSAQALHDLKVAAGQSVGSTPRGPLRAALDPGQRPVSGVFHLAEW